MSRTNAYTIATLAAALLALAPAALWPDFLVPYPYWATYHRSPEEIVLRAVDRPTVPADMATKLRVFRILVAPTVPMSWLGIWRPEFTRLAFPDGIITEVGVAPSGLVWQYFRVAFPEFLCIFIIVAEVLRRRSAA